MSFAKHTLYVVATPIGNRRDITQRAIEVLQQVSRIYAEDSRHSLPLLRDIGVTAPVVSLHEHNEATRAPDIVEELKAGASVALISDAGTPLISDPGYVLVRMCLEAGISVSPIPGASALTAALSVSGLPTDRFLFAGFPPARATARANWLQDLADSPDTLVLYESPHRIVASLESLRDSHGANRQITLLRELTKRYETVLHGAIEDVLAAVGNDSNQQRGEFVLVVAGKPASDAIAMPAELDRMLDVLLPHVPIKTAARITAELFETTRKVTYDRALQRQQRQR